jgi:hypothetical protein
LLKVIQDNDALYNPNEARKQFTSKQAETLLKNLVDYYSRFKKIEKDLITEFLGEFK